jgi:hypothetical protein
VLAERSVSPGGREGGGGGVEEEPEAGPGGRAVEPLRPPPPRRGEGHHAAPRAVPKGQGGRRPPRPHAQAAGRPHSEHEEGNI